MVLQKPMAALSDEELEEERQRIRAREMAESMTEDRRLAKALDEVVGFLCRFLVLPRYGAETIALYCASTFVIHDVGSFAPMLVLRSAEMRSGKTSTMDLIGELVREPVAAANTSPAALYRVMAKKRPTLLLDEVDAYLRLKTEQAEAIRGVLNAGHRRGRYSMVLRSNEKGDIEAFDVFGPKVLAGIGRVAGTLADRSITLNLRRKLPTERVERLRIARLADDLAYLRSELSNRAAENLGILIAADPDIPEELNDRAADNWELMLAIADVAGGHWPETARAAALALNVDADDEGSPRIKALEVLREYFRERRDAKVFASAELVGALNDDENSGFASWHNGTGAKTSDLSRLLREFGIRPAQIKTDGQKIRGYRRDWFDDVFARYIPDSAGTPVPEEAKTLPDNEIGPYHQGTEYRNKLVPDQQGTTASRYPVPDGDHINSLSHKGLTDNGTEVPGKTAGNPHDRKLDPTEDLF